MLFCEEADFTYFSVKCVLSLKSRPDFLGTAGSRSGSVHYESCSQPWQQLFDFDIHSTPISKRWYFLVSGNDSYLLVYAEFFK
jgi:hypothetical protein